MGETMPSESTEKLTPEEQSILLRLAREALVAGICGKPLPPLALDELPERLRQPGSSFVTLTKQGDLRGCIGSLEPSIPLAEDVRVHAIAAALEDYRFPPVTEDELPLIEIEISRLTPMRPLEYTFSEDLLTKLRPGIHGVVIADGARRGTFLPQVWAKVPEPEIFLSMLCNKIGLPGDTWRKKKMSVFVYEVEEFHEEPGPIPDSVVE
jgi:AmmeMemoRadiSam system protein A